MPIAPELRPSPSARMRARSPLRAARLGLCLIAALVAPLGGQPVMAKDPTTKAECLRMVRGPLEAQCRSQFAGQPSQLGACLQLGAPLLEQVCDQFFGDGVDFCATCTSTCTRVYASGDGQRRECLAMCMEHPGCS